MNGKPIFLSTIVLFIIILAIHHQSANAITIGTNQTSYPMVKYQLIGIQLSPTCLTLIKNHMPTNCPTYDKLKPLDNTNPLWEGKWINDTYFHRELPRVKNHWVQNPNNIIVMVDPDPNFSLLAKMIIIQPDNFTYINPDETIGNNHTRNEYHNRYVTACSEATVAPNLFLIEDTLHYLENGCKLTAYKDKTTVTIKATPWDYNNPFSSLHLQSYLSEMMHGHTFFIGNHTQGGLGPSNCIMHQCNYKDPFSNPKWSK